MNVEQPNPEFRYLLSLLKGNSIPASQPNAEHLIQLISDHRVIAQVARNIQHDSGLKGQVDSLNLSNKLAQLRLVEVLHQLKLLFADLPFVLLKGPALSQVLYNDPAERRSRDIDILIRPEDFDATMQRMIAAGYRLLTPYATQKQKANLQKHYQNVELEHPAGELYIEIHWSLASLRSASSPSFNSLITRSIELGNQSFTTFDNLENIAYLSMHGALHAFFRLQWLIDIRVLRAQITDEQALYRHLAERHWTVHYRLACELHAVLFDDPIPEELENPIGARSMKKLVDLCLDTMYRNDTFARGGHTYGGLRGSWTLHRLRFLLAGFQGLRRSLISRNVRPENWAFFAFPDRIFFLNHLFSRPIWLSRKLFGKKT